MEDYTIHNGLECHKDAYHDRNINIIMSISGIIHTLLRVAVFWKLYIQSAVASEFTDGYIIFIYKAVNKTKAIRKYMESLALHTGAPTVNLEDNTSCISVVEEKRVTPRVKHIEILCLFSTISIWT